MGDSQATLLLMKQLKGARAPSASVSAPALHRAASARAPFSLLWPRLQEGLGGRLTPRSPWSADLNKNPVEGFSAGLVEESDPFKWEIMIMGPPDTP